MILDSGPIPTKKRTQAIFECAKCRNLDGLKLFVQLDPLSEDVKDRTITIAKLCHPDSAYIEKFAQILEGSAIVDEQKQ